MNTFIKMLFIPVIFIATTSCVTVHDEHQPPSERLSSLHSDGPRKRVLILPFINDSIEKDPSIAKAGRDALILGLNQTDNFVIVDNQDIPKNLNEYLKEGGYNFEEIAKFASELGISGIIEGRIKKVRAKQTGDSVGLIRSEKNKIEATLTVRAYSPNQRKEVLNETREGTSTAESRHFADQETAELPMGPLDITLVKEALYSACQGMILPLIKALDKISWQGRIALVKGDRIYLTAGKLTGLNIGDILRVSGEGNDIYDPGTGVLIGHAPGNMKGTLEVISYFGKDGAIALIHSGSNFKENDGVELY
jgi:hypothetical protein